jgi:hypothetical protein
MIGNLIRRGFGLERVSQSIFSSGIRRNSYRMAGIGMHIKVQPCKPQGLLRIIEICQNEYDPLY